MPAVPTTPPPTQVVAHQAGESTEQLHSRYVEALVDLGKEHGVQLELAE